MSAAYFVSALARWGVGACSRSLPKMGNRRFCGNGVSTPVAHWVTLRANAYAKFGNGG